MSKSGIAPTICDAYVSKLMAALSVHAATADPALVREGLSRLDAVRCATRGEKSDEEKAEALTRAIGLLVAWSVEDASKTHLPAPRI